MTPPLDRVQERPRALRRTGEPATTRHPGRAPRTDLPAPRRRAPVAAGLALIRRDWVAAMFGVSAVFAAVTAVTSFNAPERLWGLFASVSYAASAVIAAGLRRRGAGLAATVALVGAMLAPLAWMALTGRAQPEVGVIIRSAHMFLHQGTPYASPAALAAAHTWRAYDPYLPALIVFGIPRALGGGVLADPRIWFGVAFVITFAAALRVARVARPAWWTLLVTASPIVALPLAVGGDDLPVFGLLCLGLALAGRAGGVLTGGVRGVGAEPRGVSAGGRPWRWPVAAGLALGLAAAMKGTAWPALAVVVVLLARRGGWRAAGWFSVTVLGVALAVDGPAVAASPAATVVNTVLYPLGLAKAASPAASLLPGHVLAGAGAWGHWAALVLMALAGAGVGASLLIRPPKDAQPAGWRLALGMTLLFVLAPASRVGHSVYPLGLAAWLLLSRMAPRRAAGGTSADPVPALGRSTAPHAHDRVQPAAARFDDSDRSEVALVTGH